MKKFSLLLLSTLMAVCLFTACSDDDDDDDNNIVGKWKYVNTTADVKTSDAEATAIIKEDIEGEVEDPTVFEFTEDGKALENGELQGSYTVKGNVLTIIDKEHEDETRKFVINGKTMSHYYDATEYYNSEGGKEYLEIDFDVTVEKAIVSYNYAKQ